MNINYDKIPSGKVSSFILKAGKVADQLRDQGQHQQAIAIEDLIRSRIRANAENSRVNKLYRELFQDGRNSADQDKASLYPGLDHIITFINALDSEGMSAADVRSAIIHECTMPIITRSACASAKAKKPAPDCSPGAGPFHHKESTI